ncbi:uncharacterized protein LOC131162517 [Malania oleifera]|uniref:uncharacterized protein LOC131162517 n=1 Tax=Malania oleifera TaxID=397392 RepID=UPI0025AEA404|nr:uncharacterized protein LOC131162517 [Malania oleifera]
MGNIIGSFLSGLGKVISDLFGSPLDFLSGKSCSSVCQTAWDFICYIENFCVANLMKMAMVLALCYIVLLFFYLLYKVGICNCVCRGLCRMVWACCSACFTACHCVCTFCCVRLFKLKRVRRRHRRCTEDYFDSTSTEEQEDNINDETFSGFKHKPIVVESTKSLTHRRRDYRRSHIRKSLRPRRSTRPTRVGISKERVNEMNSRSHRKDGNHVSTPHDIRVSRASKFVQKGSYEGQAYHWKQRRQRAF